MRHEKQNTPKATDNPWTARQRQDHSRHEPLPAPDRRAVKWFNAEIARLCKTGMDFVLTGVFSAHTERLEKAIETALWHGYEIHVKTLTAIHKSVHGVPKEHLVAMRKSFVSDKELRRTYRYVPEVHFGLMGKGTELAHLKGKKAK